jgi:HK97 gp10 family phage protein
MITAKLEGAKELEKTLVDLAKEYGPKGVRAVFTGPIKKAMAGMLQDIQSGTPVDTGALKESTALKVGRPSKSRLRQSKAVDEHTVAEGRVGWFWKRGDKVNSYEALAVEFGTNTTPARAVLRKALQTNASGAVQILQKEIGLSIEKTAKRLARKRSKGLI